MRKLTAKKAAEMMKQAGLVVNIENEFAGDKRAKTVIGRLIRGDGKYKSIMWVQYTTWHGIFETNGPGGCGGKNMPSLEAAIEHLTKTPTENDYFRADGWQ